VTEKGRLRRFGEGPRKPDQELWLQARGLGGGRVGAGLDLSRFPLHEIGISGKREMLAVRVLEGAAGLLPQQALLRSGGSSGPSREVNFQQERSIFSGPKTIADLRSDPFGSGQRFFCGVRPRGAAASRQLHGIELPIALFDAASPFVPGNRGADMVRASALA
jgi:hypothetical protein